jgi:hypothetical protein
MVPVTGVYLEMGTKRVFACSVDWPGWCRSGRGEEQALAALATAASRYAVVPALAGVAFDPVHEVDCIGIAERVTGTSATDFGALDVAPALDSGTGTVQQAERLASLVGIRTRILAEIRASAAARAPEDLGRTRRPARFVGRRAAWHAIDHAWEIQDKAPAT